MKKNFTIAIDAMGGDNSPYKSLRGVDIFHKNNSDIKIVLLGNKSLIEKTIDDNGFYFTNLEIIHTEDNIANEDSASTILRNKQNSSIYKGLNLVKNNENYGFVSAGNTAAIMILSRMILGMIQGIDRPAICSLIPNDKSFSIMLDLGANTHVTSKNLLEFAIMGNSYFSIMKDNIKPKIGIINIGTESNKGTEILQEASSLIKQSSLSDNYIGFVEPNMITSGLCDILICDGYTGNIVIKTAEGMSQFVTSNLKKIFYKSLVNKIAYKMLEKDLKGFREYINPEKYNGATLIGVNGISVKSHGSATPYAFSCAIEKCLNFLENKLINKLKNQINNFN